MTGRRTRDWPGILREWVAARTENPLLSKGEFFKMKGIKRQNGIRKIGPEMDAAWKRSTDRSLSKVEAKSSTTLASKVQAFLDINTQLAVRGFRSIFGDQAHPGADGKPVPEVKPETFRDATAAIRAGTMGGTRAALLLSGGRPLEEAPPPEEDGTNLPPDQLKALAQKAYRETKDAE
jgi:hypothetical protein